MTGIADTGFLVAFANRGDRYHEWAVRVAESPAQLVREIGLYLDDPSRDREGRRKVVLEQCQFLDGRAAERVATFVVETRSLVPEIPASEAEAPPCEWPATATLL